MVSQVKKPLSIYIHVPFCRQACPYCAFYKEVGQKEDLTDFYLRDFESLELDVNNFELKTIYFGGGTPSLMSPQFFENMIRKLSESFSVSSELEITIEINPKTISVDDLLDLKAVGLTRPSFGIQSLRPDSLKKLGRIHSVEDALALIEKSQSLFKTFSADFIYGLPWETPEDWKKELTEIVALDVPHLSLYSLSLEPKTPFSKCYTEAQLDGGEFYEITQKILTQNKYRHYEISNFARTDMDLSQHNLAYWRGESYLGLGPSAHGRIQVSQKKWIATEGVSNLKSWKKEGVKQEIISSRERAVEYIMMWLRTDFPLFEILLESETGVVFKDLFDFDQYSELLKKKWLIEKESRSIQSTSLGRQFLNTLLRELLIDF